MPESRPRAVYLETFGCQMNMLDSELVTGALRSGGYEVTDQRESADVILFNTCSVREHAEDKVHGRMGDLAAIKRRRPEVVIGILGCMAERDGQALLRKYTQLDLVCGPGELDRVLHLIDNAIRTGQRQAALAGNTNRRSGTLSAAADELELLDLSRSFSPQTTGASAYVRITRGCNKFCSYCVVPFTRGAEVHRPPDHIVEECRRLAEAGALEITLLGQTVNHYRFDHGAAVSRDGVQRPQIGPGAAAFTHAGHRHNAGRHVTRFADLLRRIHDQVPTIRRLRFVTSFPRDFDDDALQAMADCPRICPYLHVPAQAGSNRMLGAMNRGYTVEQYLAFVDRARRIVPDVMIASDFIVGFPGETDADFQASLDLIRRCRFKNSFIFKYSPRPGTPAFDRLPDDVPEPVKRQRNHQMLRIQAEVSGEVHHEQVGKVFDVLVEGVSAKARKQRRLVQATVGGAAAQMPIYQPEAAPSVQLSGRTPGDLIVMFDGDESLVGRIVPVRIQSAKPLALFGRVVNRTS